MLLAKRRQRSDTHSWLLRFTALFLVFFVLIAIAWTLIIPFYNQLIVGGAGVLFSIVEHPNITRVHAQGDRVYISRYEEGWQEPAPFLELSRYIYFGLAPFLALFLATPELGKGRRLKLILIGSVILIFFHVLYLVSSVELAYVFVGCSEVGSLLYRVLDWSQVLLRILWEVVPILIWALLTHRIWWKQAPAQEQRRAAF